METIIIPNGDLSNGNITNYTTEETRRVDFKFGIGYDDDFKKARTVISGLIANDNRILDDPEPAVKLGELADSSVNIVVRVWCKTGDYWDVFFEINEQMKSALDEKGISIPFPQRDVHLYKHTDWGLTKKFLGEIKRSACNKIGENLPLCFLSTC